MRGAPFCEFVGNSRFDGRSLCVGEGHEEQDEDQSSHSKAQAIFVTVSCVSCVSWSSYFCRRTNQTTKHTKHTNTARSEVLPKNLGGEPREKVGRPSVCS